MVLRLRPVTAFGRRARRRALPVTRCRYARCLQATEQNRASVRVGSNVLVQLSQVLLPLASRRSFRAAFARATLCQFSQQKVRYEYAALRKLWTGRPQPSQGLAIL